MKNLFKPTLLLFVFFLLTDIALAQSKEPATIYIYRPGIPMGNIVATNINFFDENICALRNKAKLKYTIYSEGKLKITANITNGSQTWQPSTSINIIAGNTYYVSVDLKTITVKNLSKTPDIAKKEYDDISDNNLTTMEEDLENPVIPISPNQNIVVTKTDTVKQLVYVDSSQDKKYCFKKTSDVDMNIPDNQLNNDSRFAFIIGNEDYSSDQGDLSSEINVDFARNDASAFKEYALKTLGIPNNNIIFMLDATTGQMKQGISKLNLIIKNTQGNADVFVYYAGHGLPDEQTKEAYLIPVDVSGKNAADGIKLKDFYAKLTEFPSKRVTVFIDACFSGGARNQGLLAARGVKVKPKEDLLNGDIVVFTASSGEQSSLPYKEKQHGFFTYFLLKKLQESKGEITYGELSKYINDNVALQSVLINDKEQSPQVNVSLSIENEWTGFILK
jgi:hypothetical protein